VKHDWVIDPDTRTGHVVRHPLQVELDDLRLEHRAHLDASETYHAVARDRTVWDRIDRFASELTAARQAGDEKRVAYLEATIDAAIQTVVDGEH
jgi:hypothetical protein